MSLWVFSMSCYQGEGGGEGEGEGEGRGKGRGRGGGKGRGGGRGGGRKTDNPWNLYVNSITMLDSCNCRLSLLHCIKFSWETLLVYVR